MIGFYACSSQKTSIYLSEHYSKQSEKKLHQAIKELQFVELNNKSLEKGLQNAYKRVRKQAEKNIQVPEPKKSWRYYVSPDTTVAYISYIPTQTLIVSKKLVTAFEEADSVDFSPLWFHYWAHHEMGHLRKRSDAELATQFGGLNRVQVIQQAPFEFIKAMLNQTGSFSSNQTISPFSIEEEEQAEFLAAKAWKAGRKDSVELQQLWRTINPEFSWAEDYFRMHMGKIKMVK